MAERPTLKDKLLKIQEDGNLSDSKLYSTLNISYDTFRKFMNDPDSVSNAVLEKIRAFTEEPDSYLDGSKSFKSSKSDKPAESASNSVTVSLDVLKELIKFDREVLADTVETMIIMGVNKISVGQIQQLLNKYESLR